MNRDPADPGKPAVGDESTVGGQSSVGRDPGVGGAQQTGLRAALAAVREAVAAHAAGEEADLGAALGRPEFGAATRSKVPGEDKLAHVTIELLSPVTIGELRSMLGAARTLPRRPEGGSGRTVIFEETLPADGESGASVLAEVDSADMVQRLVIRADSFA